MSAFNSAFKQYKSDEKAFAVAWAAVKTKYKKEGTSWVKKAHSFISAIFDITNFYESKSSIDDKEYFVEFYASTPDKDKVGDTVSWECLEDMREQLVGREVKVKMGMEHDWMLKEDATLLPYAKIVDAFRDDKGLKALAKLNKYHPYFDNLWGSIKDKFLDATSIEFRAIDWLGTKGDRTLNKLELGGITFTGRPINEKASITNFYAKALSAYENNATVRLPQTDLPAEANNNAGVGEHNKKEVKSMAEDETDEEETKEKTENKSEKTEQKTEAKTEASALDKELEAKNKEIEELKLKTEELQNQLESKAEKTGIPKEVKAYLDTKLEDLKVERKNVEKEETKFETKANLHEQKISDIIADHYGY